MSGSFSAIKYIGPGPNGVSTTVLFSTISTTANQANVGYWSQHLTSESGIHRVLFNIQTTDNTGCTFKLEKSRDRGVTWRQVSSTAASGSTGNNPFDVVVEGLPDWRVSWVNGATDNSALFEADGAFIDSRNATT